MSYLSYVDCLLCNYMFCTNLPTKNSWLMQTFLAIKLILILTGFSFNNHIQLWMTLTVLVFKRKLNKDVKAILGSNTIIKLYFNDRDEQQRDRQRDRDKQQRDRQTERQQLHTIPPLFQGHSWGRTIPPPLQLGVSSDFIFGLAAPLAGIVVVLFSQPLPCRIPPWRKLLILLGSFIEPPGALPWLGWRSIRR